jgi:hypothetical protein
MNEKEYRKKEKKTEKENKIDLKKTRCI